MQNCPETPFVEAKIRLSDGTSHLIRRTMVVPTSGRFDDTQSELTIDGVSADFSGIGLSVLPVYNPVVTQHGIQDFIHTRPIDRYRAISDALGLTDLVAFKDALDSARSSYRNNPPGRVAKAALEIRGLLSYLRDLGLGTIAARWSNQDYLLDEDYEKIVSAAAALVAKEDVGPDIEHLLSALRREQTTEMRRVFDISPFRLRADSDELLRQLDKLRTTFGSNVKDFMQAAQAVLQATLTEFEEQRIEFWQTGLDLIDESTPQQCPFCEESTLTPELIQKRHNQVGRAKGSTESKRKLGKKVETCTATITDALGVLAQIRTKALTDEDVSKLKEVFDQSQDALHLFFEASKQFNTAANYIYQQVESINRHIQDLQEAAYGAQATKVPTSAKKLVQDLEELINSSQRLFKPIARHSHSSNRCFGWN